jgi:hypothetical protein
MPRRFFLSAALLFAALPVLSAQQTAVSPAPPSRSVTVSGISVAPLPGAPFSATAVIENERTLRDGSVHVMRTIALIARDSRGRVHNERRRFMPESFHGSPPLMLLRLFDPQTRFRTLCDPVTRIARRQLLPEEPKAAGFPNPWVYVDDLGTTTLNGLQAKGTRRTFVVSAAASGTGQPVEVVDENWYAEDLHINLLLRHSDPRSGVQTVGLSALKREEPPASLFEIPQGYTIVNVNPAPASPPEGGAASAEVSR